MDLDIRRILFPIKYYLNALKIVLKNALKIHNFIVLIV